MGRAVDSKRKRVTGETGRHINLVVPAVAPEVGIEVIEVPLEVTLVGSNIEVDDEKLARELKDPNFTHFRLLDIFNPPDERQLSLTGGRSLTRLQAYMCRSPSGVTETKLKKYEITLQFGWWSQPTGTTGEDRFMDDMRKYGNRGWYLAGIHNPPDVVNGWRTSKTVVQLMFQQCQSLRKSRRFVHEIVRLSLVPRTDIVEITDMTPTLSKLGSQGYRLVGTLNPLLSRYKQRRMERSEICFFFEKCLVRSRPKVPAPSEGSSGSGASPGEDDDQIEMFYTYKVENCVVRVTHDSTGTRVKGRWVDIVKVYAKAGWKLATILDTPGERKGLTTLVIIFIHEKPAINAESNGLLSPHHPSSIGAHQASSRSIPSPPRSKASRVFARR